MPTGQAAHVVLSLTGPVPALNNAPYCTLAGLEAAMPASSFALGRYLSLVYGSAPRAELAHWSWNTKDVIHFDLLPRPLREAACTRPLGNATYEVNTTTRLAVPAFYDVGCSSGWSRCLANTRMLWRFDGSDASRVCKGEPIHHGGNDISMQRFEDEGWEEVSHVQYYRSSIVMGGDERTRLWMERARGSGLWYRQGRMVTFDDFNSLQQLVPNCTSKDTLMCSESERIDTLSFERRVGDPGQIHPSHSHRCSPGHVFDPFYKREIVSLALGQLRCESREATTPPTATANASQGEGDSSGTDAMRLDTSGPWRTSANTSSTPSACPNLPAVLRRHASHPPEGTECLFSSWDRSRLRWGWPPPRDHHSDGICPQCLHTLGEHVGGTFHFNIRCDWARTGSEGARAVPPTAASAMAVSRSKQ